MLVQVSLDGDPARGGVVDVAPVADVVDAPRAGCGCGGVMAVAPPDWDPDTAFEKLADVSARLAAGHPGATMMSAGMSGDLEQAVRHGATHVRIGTSLLGRRNPLR